MILNPKIEKLKNYAIGMASEIIAICVIMLIALFIGFVLVSWYIYVTTAALK